MTGFGSNLRGTSISSLRAALPSFCAGVADEVKRSKSKTLIED
jgi:hypothetical protein